MSNGNGNVEMKGLSADFIKGLVQNSRQRNMYGPRVLEFAASDEAAINPAEVWPLDFETKEATTLYQGFMNAIKKADLADTILCKKMDDSVFLLHKERVALLLNPPVNEDEEYDEAEDEAKDIAEAEAELVA